MRVFFFMGRNPSNKSGLSWKIWKIARTGRVVTVFWGPARLHNRRVVPAGKLQSKKRAFGSAAAALVFETNRIQSKTSNGYERRPRKR